MGLGLIGAVEDFYVGWVWNVACEFATFFDYFGLFVLVFGDSVQASMENLRILLEIFVYLESTIVIFTYLSKRL